MIFKKLPQLLLMLSLLLTPAALAQDESPPTVSIIRFGPSVTVNAIEDGILDMLAAFGLLSTEERSTLDERQNLDGDNISIIWGDAGFDFPTVNLLLGEALDEEVDVLLTISTHVTQSAVNATLNMEDPPAVLFTSVSDPYEAGIAQSPCIKPGHVTGTESLAPYEDIVPVLQLQNPDMQVIGTIFNPTDSSGAYGAERISEVAESLGLTLEVAAINSLADLPLASEGLVSNGVEAILLPIDETISRGLPQLLMIANENAIPIVYPGTLGIFQGATIGAGPTLYYDRGANVGRILSAYLRGDIDIATTAISVSVDEFGIGVNLDQAANQDVEVSQALLDIADVVIQDGKSSIAVENIDLSALPDRVREIVNFFVKDGYIELPAGMLAAYQSGSPIDADTFPEQFKVFLDELEPTDPTDTQAQFLAELACTPERIADEQAALEAASE